MSQIEKKQEEKQEGKTINKYVNTPLVQERLKEILGKNVSTFCTSVIQIANSSKDLSKAEPSSIINAALLSTTLNIPLNNSLGQAYIVPFNVRQKDGTYKMEAQFQIGYKGLQQLAIRSGQYLELEAKEVYDGQVVEDESFLGYHFNWKGKKENAKVIGYAAYFKLVNGFESKIYMSIEDIERHAKTYSQTYKSGKGKWKDNFHKMAIKTVMKLLLNSGKAPLSIEMQNAITADQSIIKNYDGKETMDVEYADNTVEDVEAEVIEKKRELKSKNSTLDLP
ncbi:recombinase RecT [Riemerella anatipestifer]|nr:recombinase RecT [Riemerella anatipestifer]